ncbi:PPR domain-containing protein/PPR_2 domain-containing protein, partial [Cephalotus follicularis]
GFYKEAITLYSQRHSASLLPNKFTFPPLVKACAKLKSPPHGQMMHAHLIKIGFLVDIYIATALTDMYMKVNLLNDALKMFDQMPDRNMASLNAAISGFWRNGYCREALSVFKDVHIGIFRPNSVTIASVLPACRSVEHGLQIHCWAIKLGVEKDIYVATSLVTTYSNCKEMVLATKVFGEMDHKNVVSYNAFVTGLIQNGIPCVVLSVFKEMRVCLNEKPDAVTLVSVISACACLVYMQFGRQVHGFVVKIDKQFDTMVGTALVDMYSKCGCWQRAYDVFKELNGCRNLITWNSMIAGMMLNGQSDISVELFKQLEYEGLEPDSATWNSMISGFAHLGKGFDAFKWFEKMQLAGVVPSLKCITSLLPACSDLSALDCGKEIHGHAIRTTISNDEVIVTALIDMYMKCGCSSWARRIFDHFETKPDDPAFWNAMIYGYGRNGDSESAFEIFFHMKERNVEPNSVTFIGILSVCSRTGQVDEGWEAFKSMSEDYCLEPNSEHFGCMIDLLGRFGRLNEARELIQAMTDPPASVYSSLLGACRSHLDPELGEEIAIKLSNLEPQNPTPFVILSNIYAGLERWSDVERIRQKIDNIGLTKLSGFSSVE